MNEMIDKITIKTFDDLKKLFLLELWYIFFASTIIILEIALTKVSTVLTVNDTAIIIIKTDKNSVLSFYKIEKKAKKGFILLSRETAIIQLIPIKNTIGIIIINDNQRLFFSVSLFFAAKTLCQFP